MALLLQLNQDSLEPLLKYQKKKCFEEEEKNSNKIEYSYLRLLPDMSEGLIGLCIGDIMGILLSLDSKNSLTVQQQQILKNFVETLLKTSRSSLSIFKLSILYLYKLNKKLKEPLVLNVFRTHLKENNITTMESMKQAKLLFVVILMLAFKYTEDHCYYISAWSKATGIKSEIIHRVEVEVLNILDHNLFVSQETFELFSNHIIKKINKLKIDLLQSVKISYANSNYSSSSEEESTKSDSSTNIPLRCKNCSCKRKHDAYGNPIYYKKRRINDELTINTNAKEQEDNSSNFYSLPTTLYDYYKNRNGNVFGNQTLTPPTPSTEVSNETPINTTSSTTSNNLLQVDSLIIPSTPPTSQTSIFEDMEREKEIQNNELDCEEEEEDEFEDCEESVDENPTMNQTKLKSSSMAFILNPDENKIQFDSGDNSCGIQAKTISYRYRTPSPKTNFAYDNLKKVNLLEKKNGKARTTPSIVLPNTTPVGNVASVFNSLSMLSQKSNNDCNTIEDTINKNKSMELKSLLNPSVGLTMSNQNPTNYLNERNEDTTNNPCPYFNYLYSFSNDDRAKQNLLLSIYNCYAMRNIRHYQI